jgi:hypothetical protein
MTGAGLALEDADEPDTETGPVVQEGGQGVASSVALPPL